jgi:RNA polymerase sigma-70 factor, ECF subfamily
VEISEREQTEVSLILRAQQGEERAFEELVKRHDGSVLRLAMSMTGNRCDAQDVYQETFLRAFAKLHGFRFESSFKTWLLRIAANQSLNVRRKRRLRSFLPLVTAEGENDDCLLFLADDQPQPGDGLDSREIGRGIATALTRLSDRERTVFCLRHEQQLKLREIAVVLNCAEGTVKNLLFRACRKLRKSLKSVVED